jgi:hypothetical protein
MMKRICASLLAAFAMLAALGCESMPLYVDPVLGDVNPADRAYVAEKRPVQLVFSFQTKGSANAMATGLLEKRARELVAESGMFSQVSSSPVPGGAVLSIMINNVAENYSRRGFVSGATYGATANSSVTDFYIATATYTPRPNEKTITVERKHAIHSVTYEADIPDGIQPSKSFDEAFETVARQLFDHVLNDIAKDPSFQPGAARPQQAAAAG